uniref:Uncharacterized protein n=1 Tax=Monodelphis domestica TaxID=13616 RepID=A0A5F8H5F7_MONDO
RERERKRERKEIEAFCLSNAWISPIFLLLEMAPESKKTEEDEQRFSVPHIVVTRASNETIQGVPLGQDIQRTIRDEIDYGPYYRHRNPSTIDAYLRKEPPKPKQVP